MLYNGWFAKWFRNIWSRFEWNVYYQSVKYDESHNIWHILVLLINSIKKSVQEFSMAVAKTFWLSIYILYKFIIKTHKWCGYKLANFYHSKSFRYGWFAKCFQLWVECVLSEGEVCRNCITIHKGVFYGFF